MTTDKAELLARMRQAREMHDAAEQAELEPLSPEDLRRKLESGGIEWAFGYIQGLYERLEGEANDDGE